MVDGLHRTVGRGGGSMPRLDDVTIERAVAACCRQLNAELRPIIEQLKDLDRRLERCERRIEQQKMHLPKFAEASER